MNSMSLEIRLKCGSGLLSGNKKELFWRIGFIAQQAGCSGGSVVLAYCQRTMCGVANFREANVFFALNKKIKIFT
jgi:hypothetical protein